MAHRSLLVNIGRNLRDQPLHVLWAGASVVAPFVAFWQFGFGWITALTFFLSTVSIGWIVIREVVQWPPHDWWDGPLDYSSYVVGAAIGIILGIWLVARPADAREYDYTHVRHLDVHSRVYSYSYADIAAERCAAQYGPDAVPDVPFKTDQCTWVPDGDWGSCCIAHDMTYWCGGPAGDRLTADNHLITCIGSVTGFWYGIGVRMLGSPWLPTTWRWGYGHPYF